MENQNQPDNKKINIFLSWSKDFSKEIASSFKNWITRMYPQGDFSPFMSSENIKPGENTYDKIIEQLKNSDVGLIFFTKENYERPWILFECGILMGNSQTKVIPVLLDFSVELLNERTHPIRYIQPVDLLDEQERKEKILQIIKDIDENLPKGKALNGNLEREFGEKWSFLNKEISPIFNQYLPRTKKDTLKTAPCDDSKIKNKLNLIEEELKNTKIFILEHQKHLSSLIQKNLFQLNILSENITIVDNMQHAFEKEIHTFDILFINPSIKFSNDKDLYSFETAENLIKLIKNINPKMYIIGSQESNVKYHDRQKILCDFVFNKNKILDDDCNEKLLSKHLLSGIIKSKL